MSNTHTCTENCQSQLPDTNQRKERTAHSPLTTSCSFTLRIAVASCTAPPGPSSASGVMYTRIVKTIAPLRGNRRIAWCSTRRHILSGRGFGGSGRYPTPSMSSGPSVPSDQASSLSCEGIGDNDGAGVGGRTWMSVNQLLRCTGELGEGHRKKQATAEDLLHLPRVRCV